MEFITNYIDELLDYFPVNNITKKMRMDLLEATHNDYESLLQNGQTQEEASQTVINQIAKPEQLAMMIPNKHTGIYFIYWAIALIVTFGVFSYVSNPDFLQFFLPTRMEFPDIIEKYIQYFFIVLIAYAALYYFYRMLPQKYLNRTELQSAIFLYTGTVMAALYFSIAIAFVWYTFNGFLPSEITFDLVSTFIYWFYQIFFSSELVVTLYAIGNALMFVLSRQAYHLDKQPATYTFENIYQALNHEETVNPIISEVVEEKKQPSKNPLANIFASIKNRRKKQNKPTEEEKKQPTFVALEVTEEVISFLSENRSHL